ncbi:MAG: hypothetical protein LBE83_05805 [Propionibacteriaceae bacterium]|nr:hypothetical protein [Propionibacteriaceae bacterium]
MTRPVAKATLFDSKQENGEGALVAAALLATETGRDDAPRLCVFKNYRAGQDNPSWDLTDYAVSMELSFDGTADLAHGLGVEVNDLLSVIVECVGGKRHAMEGIIALCRSLEVPFSTRQLDARGAEMVPAA